ncbi:L-seryl-tRNA selenium transferase protein [Salinisphaera shabanensis E1L3A]|uniref:L-seryl-tRNA selenium transferase protein n=1 Tax=Salinisphaera shabanensis E1L3A TaxID=1033802 RepID=U2FT56_9GAMM|nr:beta-eliminating lyase-related protein [Salinisphaera shabanensis]ERJ19179.1 L-seryl-tRNA selenium transferase protein [Salinisphaera shabanensis E1L3A]
MNLYERYGLTPVINAAGTYTPLGVSRSSPYVAETAAAALGQFFVIDELQDRISQTVSQIYGVEAAALTHCVAAGITMAVAAAMTGTNETKIAALPNTRDLPSRVVIPAAHVVNYGHPILTDIRLAGATPIQVGGHEACQIAELDAALADTDTACLLLVSSRLTQGPRVDFDEAVRVAHKRSIPVIIDGAAQDIRLEELLRTGADIVLVSAHKYLAAPTAGLMIGRADYVAACRAQEKGIGRGMKASKEALCGVLAALEERAALDRDDWRDEQARKVAWFLDQMQPVQSIVATEWPDPSMAPFSRVVLQLDSAERAAALVARLAHERPAIRVMEHELAQGRLILELVPLTDRELDVVASRIASADASAHR